MNSTGTDASTSAPPTKDSLAWVGWLRFVAIRGVVAIHTVAHTAVAEDARETVRGPLAIWLDIAAIFAVPLFVMISGALLLEPTRYPGPGRFIRRRALRLLPALVFWHVWYYLILIWVEDSPMSPGEALVPALNGRLYTALYFFWIVFGLALLTPILVPFLASAGRRAAAIAAVALCAMTALTAGTRVIRESPVVFADWALTWWFPYLGIFLLGWVLRSVVLRGPLLGLAIAAAVALAWLLPWQWRNPAAPA